MKKVLNYGMQKNIVWKNSMLNMTEFARIEKREFITVKGFVTGTGFDKPWQVSYLLTINNRWEVQGVHIEVLSEEDRIIQLHKNEQQQWLNEKGEHLPAFDGCVDVDISLTPFTNSLPVNRLQLTRGEGHDLKVLYIDLKQGICKKVVQRYTNKGKGLYKYDNEDSGFTTELIVDEEGIVVDYPGIWQRIY